MRKNSFLWGMACVLMLCGHFVSLDSTRYQYPRLAVDRLKHVYCNPDTPYRLLEPGAGAVPLIEGNVSYADLDERVVLCCMYSIVLCI